jgi:hypothetical protein
MGVDVDPFDMLCAISECEEEQVAEDVEAEAGLNGGRLLLGLWVGNDVESTCGVVWPQ